MATPRPLYNEGNNLEDLGPELQEAEMADEDLYREMAPKGQFTPKGLNALVKATNALLPAFEQTADYPQFEAETTELPTDFVRVLSMFAQAADDAVDSDVLDAEMALSMDGIINDTGLLQLAGRIDMLAKDKAFKKFLKEEAPEEGAPVEEEEVLEEAPPEMDAEEEDDLFMGRL